MTQDFTQAQAFVAALAGDPATAVFDWRAIHDTDKAVPAIPFRGTLADCWSSIVHYNGLGYGIFATIAAMDGNGRELSNVWYLRAHYCDLDNLSARQSLDTAAASQPAPWFGVQSSPGKFHVYWPVTPYQGNDRFQLTQRKLRQLFDGDKRVIDAARVMRLPGTLHLKNPAAPHLVTCFALPGYGQPLTIEALETALQAVNVIDGGNGQRHELGDPALAAPSLDWIKTALKLVDPNNLDRGEWIALTAGVKQSGWSLTDPDTLFAIWSEWCARYTENDLGENLKQWNAFRNTELGWQSLVNRIPSLKAMIQFGGQERTVPAPVTPGGGVTQSPPLPSDTAPPMPAPRELDCSGPVLTHFEQQEWFKGCVYVVNIGEMMTTKGRFLNTGQFNVAYGGKKFIIDEQGKLTNEAWAAATRSTLWTVPKVDHIRFLPERAFGEVITDDLGREGVNTYQPINLVRTPGDAGPFLRHIAAMLPDANDQRILIEYLAHNAKYPGYKIPWAFVIQSAEGAGKGVLKSVIAYVMGRSYTYFPNAKQLGDSGSQFNAWMRRKLFILADEIKVDDRRDMIEVLKPMISERVIEIQGKGHDQDLEDNAANWGFFSNWKDAIPVNKNGRRFAIFFSALQTAQDMLDRGMNEAYFNALYNWLDGPGNAIVADYLLSYPIERGAIPMRAPDTSSTGEAVSLSRSPVERMIAEAVEDGLAGFRGGWISGAAVAKRIKETGCVSRAVSAQVIGTILEEMGYAACGRAPRPYMAEDHRTRPYLFHIGGVADVAQYGRAQGYE